LHTDPESHNAQRYRQTDGRHDDANADMVGWNKATSSSPQADLESVPLKQN